MTKAATSILLFFTTFFSFANDGAYFGSGNHLVPINESSISVKKEILTLKKRNNLQMEVTVYYEFYNPGQGKNLKVGFEAFAPQGDATKINESKRHPYMHNFTVELNSAILGYDVSYLPRENPLNEDSLGKSMDFQTIKNQVNEGEFDFIYVYHFDAFLKNGLNIIKHTYTVDLSNSVEYLYSFSYILTAAKRWANKQIDDFTLIIDMGAFEAFTLNKTFFDRADEWILNGIGRFENTTASENQPAVNFYMQNGTLQFQKTNFKIQGDLFLSSEKRYGFTENSFLSFSYRIHEFPPTPKTPLERRIYRNLPYARRGYVFKNQELATFYKKFVWYIPDPNFIPDFNALSEIEKAWINKLGNE
ncbi:YARHG domain-containing protein [Flavobacterium sp.]|uniref:YARHG domain-containing protein n=1 Tax=Flavobacterium sp. TaxID=239 RepID=UPI002623082A|nr:YARHG domain-containing protein [Flavobacterium sp.]